MLRSDRGPAYTSALLKSVNDLLGIEHAFGATYHPESQAPVASTHKRMNKILRDYAHRFPAQWDRWTPLAQWSIRTTPRVKLRGRIPDEIATRLRPQGPVDALFARIGDATLSPDTYVVNLIKHLESVHKSLSSDLEALQNSRQYANSKLASDELAVGDLVLVRRPPAGTEVAAKEGLPRKLMPKFDVQPYEIAKAATKATYIVRDSLTHATDGLGFSQPIHISRLRPIVLSGLAKPIDQGYPQLRLRHRRAPPEHGRLTRQAADGRCFFEPGRLVPDVGGSLE